MIVVSEPTQRHTNLATAARHRLQAVPYAAVGRVSCEDCLGRLVLRGRVPSYYLKQLAQEAVAGLEGVLEVINEVQVEGGTEAKRMRPDCP